MREFKERGHKQTYSIVEQTYSDPSIASHASIQMSGVAGLRAIACGAASSPRASRGGLLVSSAGNPRRTFTTLARQTVRGISSSASALPRAFPAVAQRSVSTARYDPVFDAADNAFIAAQSIAGVPFALPPSFVGPYADRKAPFGFNGLGEFVYTTRYARIRPEDGQREQWHQTVERVVNGTFNMQRKWVEGQGLGWNPWKAHRSARDMYERIFTMKFLPPGRGLWAMGTPLTEERGLFAALNNCAFVSTQDIAADPVRPFTFLMDASMLGVGVGFDCDGAGKVAVSGALPPVEGGAPHVVGDSREGWVESVAQLLRVSTASACAARVAYVVISFFDVDFYAFVI